jgi:hypothetical protein
MADEQARVELGGIETAAAELACETPARSVDRNATFDARILARILARGVDLATPRRDGAQCAARRLAHDGVPSAAKSSA